MLKLPKDVAQHPQREALEAAFLKDSRPIRENSTVIVSQWAYDEKLRQALREAVRTGHLVQGLEQIGKQLDREKKGIEAVRLKAPQASERPAEPRLSRLILIANDGSERFYHDCESVLQKHADRAWGCLLAATAEQLGLAFAAKGQPAKAFMIDDRKALGMFLTAWAKTF